MVFRGLKVKSHDFYTGGRAFWELPKDLQEDYAEVGFDANVENMGWKVQENHRKNLGKYGWITQVTKPPWNHH